MKIFGQSSSNNQGVRVPKLRFPGFEGEWERLKFSEFTWASGKRNKENLDLAPYAITNESGFIPQNEAHNDFGYMKDTDRKAYNIVTPNSFAYNPARINIGSIGYYEGTENVIVSSLYEVFQTADYINDRFLWYWFKSSEFSKWIKRLQEGSVRLYFYYDKLCECQMFAPSVVEQKKIAQFLEIIEKRIKKQRQLVEVLKSYKRGVLSAIFDEDSTLRKKDRAKWERHKIGEFLFPRVLKQIPSSDTPLMAFTAEGGVCQKGDRYDRSFLVKDENKQYKRTEYNDFIYSSNNLDVGSIGLNKYGTAVISDVYEIFIIRNADPTFISEAIQRKRTLQNILRFRQGVIYGQYRIYAEDFLSVEINLPDYETQNKYASTIATIDEKLFQESTLLSRLEKYKIGLLQQMFI